MKDCMVNGRNPVFDVVKALMMLWVIWGHLGLYGIVDKGVSIYMHNAKIGVNMPVFFVIGGCLAASAFEEGDWCKLISRAIHFMWPQVMIAVCYTLILSFLGGAGAFSWVMGMWFLHTYAIIYLLSAFVFSVTSSNWKRWAFFLVLYALMLFWPSRFRLSWFGQIIHMFPYFVFGLMCLRGRVLRFGFCLGCVCGALYLAVVFLQGDSSINGMNFWKVNAHWKVVLFDWHEGVTFVARTCVGICGSIFVLFAVDTLLRLMPWLIGLSSFGITSLGVYVIHEYPLYVLGWHLPGLPLPAWSRLGVAIAYFLACHFFVMWIKSNSFVSVIFFGNEQWLRDRLNVLK